MQQERVESLNNSFDEDLVSSGIIFSYITPPPSPTTVFQNDSIRHMLATMFCLISVAGISGNGLVLVSILHTAKLRTITNVFVFNLGIADLLTCSVLPLNAVAVLSIDGYPLPNPVCVFNVFVLMVCIGTSINTLTLIAINRWIRITRSIQRYHRIFRPNIVTIMLSFAWILPIILTIIPLVSDIAELGFNPKYSTCLWAEETFVYKLLVAIAYYPAQLILTFYSYAKIYLYVRKSSRALRRRVPSVSESGITVSVSNTPMNYGYPSSRFAKQIARRQLQVTKNLFFVLCAFLVCLSPYVFNLFIPNTCYFLPYTAMLLAFNSCLNPLIYAVKHPDFRRAFRSLLCHNAAKHET